MPERLVPMLAKLSKLPEDDGGWAYEIKWDGVRAVAYAAKTGVRLESRNLNDVTPRYPEVQGLAEALGKTDAVFDGEVVAFDEQGRSSFERLQGRMHLTRGVEARAKLVPVVYCIFDLLWIDGEDLMRLPYTERRERLEGLNLDGPAWRVPSYSTGNGEQLLSASAEQNLEGIVCKRLDSPYEPGRRGGTWLKVKNTRSQELVIGGWTPGEGRRAGRLGALHLGYYDDGKFRYAGKVGTGFTEKELDRLEAIMRPLTRDTSPFEGEPHPPRGTYYVDPVLVAEIDFTEWTSQRMLRHPSYKGLRDDKRALDVVLEKVDTAVRAPLLGQIVGGELEGSAEIELDGHKLELTNLDEVVYPQDGFTKGEVIDYYLRIGPALLPHVRDRLPGNVTDVAGIVSLANDGVLELRPSLSTRENPERPTFMVLDLSPGEGTGLDECRAVAMDLKRLFDQVKLEAFPKTTGSDGIQVYVPLGGDRTYDDTKPFAKAVAETLERVYPDRVVSRIAKSARAGRVLVDWSQNSGNKSTLAPYSLRAEARPTVSMPLTWEEVDSGPSDALVFESEAALKRVDERGDLFAPVLTLKQDLPSFD